MLDKMKNAMKPEDNIFDDKFLPDDFVAPHSPSFYELVKADIKKLAVFLIQEGNPMRTTKLVIAEARHLVNKYKKKD